MARYRKLPVEVEAVQWWKDGDSPHVKVFPKIDKGAYCRTCGGPFFGHGEIVTLEGQLIVCPGDYIIQGVAGEYYPCKPDIFERTYECVED